MRLYTLAFLALFVSFGSSATAQTCGKLCDRDFWKSASQEDIVAEISKSDVNARNDDWGWTPLMVVAMGLPPENLNALMEAGADLDAQDKEGRTALMWAANRGTAANVEVLLDAGADVNAQDEDGKTALTLMADRDTQENLAVLIDAGADVNAQDDDGKTALISVAEKGFQENLAVLLDAGADVNAWDKKGRSALILVAMDGTAENLKALLDAGAVAGYVDVEHLYAARDYSEQIKKDVKSPWDYAQQNEKIRGTDAYWMLNEARLK